MVHRHVKLPSHLYISPPSPPNNNISHPFSPSTYLSLSRLTYYTLPGALLNETSNGAIIAVTHRIPGFRTSASFLHSLRANLALATSLDSLYSSPPRPPPTFPLLPYTLRAPSQQHARRLLATKTQPHPTTTTASPPQEETSSMPSTTADDPLSALPPLTTSQPSTPPPKPPRSASSPTAWPNNASSPPAP
ncbi:hypothetical protein GJ744_002321 [Endocarpon pusillum]|uniref:Uncharacterized protein n=1 Tax=Endocarpon pusillum TaxID=364733 RepID=A0A8H7APW6_9EURO|nr:hypothetical protein GJ744_002321 [Endocarpon pusillum]